ncbi:MAG: precorrin-3B C(17)-methyltransferase [Eubacteriales bacterium]|nr:precorrin-3B C(17)-methyltransferase [Eubacteriales bacterium]
MGKVFVVGLGPGGSEQMTLQARQALDQAEVLCGYGVYLDLITPMFPQKQTLSTGMKREMERCRMALDTAREGKTVALVCSGDAGVYGMASPLLELAEEYPDVEVEVVAGVTAALSGSAVLGAPLGHDFCVISLSDLLTPWEVIQRRLQAAAMGDFIVCLYNPSSHKRRDYLQRACDILLSAGKSPQTLCGLVRNIGREGQAPEIMPLSQLRQTEVDMFTTVFIGSAATKLSAGRLVTPRGYRP